jgi:hypothetical protein
MLVALAVHFISMCLLGFRRDITYGDRTKTWTLDAINVNLAIGGSTATIISLALVALNVEFFDTGDDHGNVLEDGLSLQDLSSTMVQNISTDMERVEGEHHDDHPS